MEPTLVSKYSAGDDLEVQVWRGERGYSVSLFDIEAGQRIVSRIYADRDAADEHALQLAKESLTR